MTFPLAFLIGFSVASIPGPTIILVATETLRKGARAGLLAMMAPFLLDALLMVPLGLLLQSALFYGTGAFLLGLAGAAFLAWIGAKSIQSGAMQLKDPSRSQTIGSPGSILQHPPQTTRELSSFLKGVITHLTSPYPYLYWGTVGASFIRRGFATGGARSAALFPVGFWFGAAAFTSAMIYLLARGKKLLPPHLEPYLHQFSGALLIGSAIFLAVSVWKGLF